MAISVNRHTIVGRLGGDPDPIPNSEGVKISVATSETWKDRNGEKQERTVWHKIVIWNEPTAKFVKQYAKKGDLVYVEGQVETRSWEKDGTTQYITETVVRPFSGSVQLQSKEGGSRSDDRGSSRDSNDRNVGGSRPRTAGREYGGGGFGSSNDIDDDIPF